MIKRYAKHENSDYYQEIMDNELFLRICLLCEI